MATGRKPVIVRRFSRDWLAGYLSADFSAPELELLEPAGKLLRLPWNEIKWICLVRELPGPTERANPERLLHKRFATRPRTAGLWLRLTLGDGELLEGLAANDMTLLAPNGLLLTPPDMRSNTQRIFIPRQSIASLEVLGLIGPAGRRKPPAPRPPELFPAEPAE